MDFEKEITKAQKTAAQKAMKEAAARTLNDLATDLGKKVAATWFKTHRKELEQELAEALEELWPGILEKTAQRWAKEAELTVDGW